MRTRKLSSRRGFTLMEGIAAIVVLSVAVPPMMWSLRQAHRHRVDQTMASRARWLACEKLEDVIADRHANSYAHLTVSNYPAEASISGFPGFTRSVAFAETGYDLVSVGTGCMRVTCTVTYKDGAGATRSLDLSTVLTDYTP